MIIDNILILYYRLKSAVYESCEFYTFGHKNHIIILFLLVSLALKNVFILKRFLSILFNHDYFNSVNSILEESEKSPILYNFQKNRKLWKCFVLIFFNFHIFFWGSGKIFVFSENFPKFNPYRCYVPRGVVFLKFVFA